MHRAIPLVVAAALGATALHPFPGVRAQEQGRQPTFRSTTALVEVDAVILDRQNRFVTGLTADDLELYEDGVRQDIQQFSLITHERGARDDVALDDPEVAVERASQRVFVLLFDEGHLSDESLMRVRSGAEAFVREQMGEGDIGGVFANNGMFRGRLTTDREELMTGIRQSRPAFGNRQSVLAPFRAFPRIPSEHDALRIAEGARELVDDLAARACRQEPQECLLAGGVGQVENLIQQKSRLYIREARIMTAQTLQNLQTVAIGLSRFPGRKTIIFLSEGFFSEESRGTLETVAAQAARSNTTIYSIDGRGLINSMSVNPDVVRRERARSAAFDTGEDGPTILTAGTGGLMVRNIDDMSRAFGMVVRDTSTYYAIGYEPSNPTMDGKFRKIDVRAKTPGLRIRARKGYLALALPQTSAAIR